jgi:NAD(P)-dependent dehydrogenase (short-subunit alcohol dehydrogenase family)
VSAWTADDIPDQTGRRVIVTGANSGLGLCAARALAGRGARVVLACRNAQRGAAALADVRAAAPGADAELATLDLGDLGSVRAFAAGQREPVDLLVNNAGLMAPPRGTTADGFEVQIGTNHLGHFALTGLLLDRLLAAPAARVVTLSSIMHRTGRIDFDDLQGERSYRRWRAYGQSKLANLLFMRELDRRARTAGMPLTSVAAHPGYAATHLQTAAPPLLDRTLLRVLNRVVAQSAEHGALPALYAATAPVPSGSYAGPDGPGEVRGARGSSACPPARRTPTPHGGSGTVRAAHRRALRVRLIMAGTAMPTTLAERVERWIADDPDPGARAELRALLDGGGTAELEERFARGLSFGTAGLRGPLGAGPSRMNVATVRRASGGLARFLLDAVPGAAVAGVVVGHDARHGSARFAAEAAAVFAGAGLRTLRLPPAVADAAARVRRAATSAARPGSWSPRATIRRTTTATRSTSATARRSRRPRCAHLRRDRSGSGRLAAVPLGDGAEALGGEVAEAYLQAILAELPAVAARELRMVYTPLHGVGGALCLEALDRAGFPAPEVVAEQAQPDPDFPTAPRPNPEEPGVLDLAVAAAQRAGADIVLASDPDADRLAVAVPAEGGGWRRLHGDETGVLLADFLLEHAADPERALLVTTVASSTLLGRMARRRRRPLRRDADRVQVDHARGRRGARAPAPARLRGGARLRRL